MHFSLYQWARSLQERGMDVLITRGGTGLALWPNEKVTEQDVSAARLFKGLILQRGYRSAAEIALWTGWYVHLLTRTAYVMPGASYPQETDPLPTPQDWADSLQERGMYIGAGPMGSVSLAPEELVTGLDIRAAGAYGVVPVCEILRTDKGSTTRRKQGTTKHQRGTNEARRGASEAPMRHDVGTTVTASPDLH